MTKFYIVRHGQTYFNTIGRIQGWCDSPLTEKGIQQALNLGKAIESINFDICFCSSSERAIDTAKCIIGERKIEIYPTKKLKEQHFGKFEAEYVKDVVKDDVIKAKGYKCVGGEDYQEVIDRTRSVLIEIAGKYPDNNVLIVTHGSVIKRLIDSIDPVFFTNAKRIDNLIPNCSVTEISYDGEFKLDKKPYTL